METHLALPQERAVRWGVLAAATRASRRNSWVKRTVSATAEKCAEDLLVGFWGNPALSQ
jgi:hypothetical protein